MKEKLSLRLKNKLPRFILLFFPVLYISFAFIDLSEIGGFNISGPDPIYAYLLNGTNLASGNLEVGHVDHPGTPVQCFAAMVIFTKHLVSGKLPLYQDVLSDPESYLYACSIVLILLLGLVTYFTGAYIYRNTGNIILSMFFQLSPIIYAGGFYYSLRPETLIIITSTFFTAFLYVQLSAYEQSPGKAWSNKQVILIAAGFAFLMAIKLTCIPFFLIGFFVFRNNKQKMLFFLAGIFSFIVFIIPALSRHRDMYYWFKGLITHDGIYGHGNARVVNPSAFLQNIGTIFTSDCIFTSIYAFISLAFVIALIKILRKKSNSIYNFFIIGLWTSISILIMMVAKHYNFYYLIPAQCYFPLGIVVSYKIFSVSLNYTFSWKYKKVYQLSGLFIFIGLLVHQSIGNPFVFKRTKNPVFETIRFLKSYQKIPVIISSLYESSFIEPCLSFGIVYSGNLRHKYFRFITDKYPDTYLYNIVDEKLLKWNLEVMPQEIFQKSSRVLFYFKNETETTQRDIIKKVFASKNETMLVDVKKIFVNDASHESIYLLEADTNIKPMDKVLNSITVSSDLETLTADKSEFTSTISRLHFAKAIFLNTEVRHSGKNSIKLDKDRPYGLDLELEAHPKDFIDITVWRKSKDQSGLIVIQANDLTKFYETGQAIMKTNDTMWEQIQCRTQIPENYSDSIVKFYLFYPGKNEAYFDDIEIKYYTSPTYTQSPQIF